MTTDIATPIITHTVAGTGPYAVPWPFGSGELVVRAELAGVITPLAPGQWTVAPEAGSSGAVTLATVVATNYAGAKLTIERATVLEQGWQGQSSREIGLMANLDRTMRGLQDMVARSRGMVRVLGSAALPPIAPVEGATLIWQDGAFVPGPTGDQIAQAQAAATLLLDVIDILETSRSAMVEKIAAGYVPVIGATYLLDGLAYVGRSGATAIADLPGLAPAEPVYVDHFGATRNTAQATAAMAYANVTGADLHLMAATYEWRNVIAPANGRLTLRGVFGATVVKVPNGFDGQCFGRSAGAGSTDYIKLEGIIFDANKDNGLGVTAASAVAFSGVREFTAKDCVFRNATGYGFGLQAYPGTANTGPQSVVYMESCHVENCGEGVGGDQYDGFDIKDADHITLLHCTANGNALEGFDVRGRSVNLDACDADNNGGSGFQLSVNPATTLIGQFTMKGCSGQGNAGRGLDIVVTDATSNLIYVTVHGGFFSGNGVGGRIRVDNSKVGKIAVFGTQFIGNTGNNLIVQGNDLSRIELHGVAANDGGAVGVYAAGPRLRIIGGTMTGNATYGIAEDASLGTRTSVSDADVRGNTVGPILDRGNMSISDTLGWVNEFRGQTATLDASTTGLKTITIAHGMAVTPTLAQQQVSVSAQSSNAIVCTPRVFSADATNLTVGVFVITAAAGGTVQLTVSANAQRVAA